jgi:monoamine oxidase
MPSGSDRFHPRPPGLADRRLQAELCYGSRSVGSHGVARVRHGSKAIRVRSRRTQHVCCDEGHLVVGTPPFTTVGQAMRAVDAS